jgi:rubrerythrin
VERDPTFRLPDRVMGELASGEKRHRGRLAELLREYRGFDLAQRQQAILVLDQPITLPRYSPQEPRTVLFDGEISALLPFLKATS